MAKRIATRVLSDAHSKARSSGANPSRASFIHDGIKYKAGCEPVQVCPAPGAVINSSVLAAPPRDSVSVLATPVK
jgi:hypothetical protein